MNYIIKILAICLLLCACSSEEICNRKQGLHEWNGYRWPSDALDLNIKNNTHNSNWSTIFNETVSDWNNLDTALWLYEDSQEVVSIDVILVEGAEWLGLAQVWLSKDTGLITRAKISLNKSLLNNFNSAGKKHVLCQEIGHALSLFHIEGDTCMDNCSSVSSDSARRKKCTENNTKTTPNQHDKDQLIQMYGQYTGTCI